MTTVPLSAPIRYSSVDTPVGRLWVGYDRGRVCAAKLTEDEHGFVDEYEARFGRPLEPDPSPPADLLGAISDRLTDGGEVPFDLDRFTPFQRAVLEAVAGIPPGDVRTYGEVALAVGRPGAARAVGEVMRTNQIPVLIPCHRVVRAGGDIGRYSPDPSIKRRLLILEGALPDQP